MEDGIGHNSKIIQKALAGLKKVKEGEGLTEEGWLQYGAALNEGREMFPSDEQFGEWIVTNNLSDTNQAERLAAMWAAKDLDRFYRVKGGYPNVRTVRGLHAKWKEEEKAKEDEDDTDNTDDGVADEGKGDNDSKPSKGGSSSNKGGSKGSNKPSGGNSDDKNTNKDDGKPSWNTENPDTEVVKEPISRVASSMVGVVTTFKFWEQTNGRRVDTEELANALLHEIRNEALEKYTEEEVISYVDDMRYVLNTIAQSLPVLNGPDTNIVNFKQIKENHK